MSKFAFLILSFAIVGCGVKGKPLPPLEPLPIGDGTLQSQKKQKQQAPAVETAPREEQNNKRPGVESL